MNNSSIPGWHYIKVLLQIYTCICMYISIATVTQFCISHTWVLVSTTSKHSQVTTRIPAAISFPSNRGGKPGSICWAVSSLKNSSLHRCSPGTGLGDTPNHSLPLSAFVCFVLSHSHTCTHTRSRLSCGVCAPGSRSLLLPVLIPSAATLTDFF